MQGHHIRISAHLGPYARTLVLLVLLLGKPGRASDPTEVPLEHRELRPVPLQAQHPSWLPGAGKAQAARTPDHWTVIPLQFRFPYETRTNETYLLTRHFTLWTNGLVASTLSISNLVSGDGTTRWETNQIEPVAEKQLALLNAEGNLELAAGMPRSPAGRDSYRNRQTEGVVFKLGSAVLARGLARDMALGISRVTIERYEVSCGSCSASAKLAPGRPGPLFGGIVLRFGLGQTDDGQAVGELAFSTTLPTLEMWQPEALRLLALPECVTVITDPDSGRLRQVGSSQCLADLLKLDAYRYQIVFYATNTLRPSQDPHTPLPTNGLLPFVTWTIQNPDGANATNRLQVIESAGAFHITNSYTWQGPVQGWELLAGNGLRRQTWTTSWDADHRLRTDMLQTFTPADRRLVAQTLTKYQRFDWGDGLVEESQGTAEQACTTSYRYYDQPGQPWHGRLQQVLRADGSWERYDYDLNGRLKTQYSPYGNTSPEDWRNSRAITYDYSPWTALGDQANLFALRPRMTTETVRGILVARSYFLATTNHTLQIQCSSASRAPFDGPALCTTNRYYPADSPQPTRLQSVEHPDGTLTLYTYTPGPAGFTTVIRSGHPNPTHTDITDGTQTVTVTGTVGQLLLKEVYDIAPGRTNILTYRESYSYLDPLQRSYRVTYLDGTAEIYQSGCCGLEARTDRDGLVTLYAHDGLKRLKTESRLVDGSQMLTTSYQYDAADHRLYSARTGTDGTNHITISGTAYDTAGRPVFQTNALGGVTALSYGVDKEGRPITTNCYPDGGIRVEMINRDGNLYQVHGSAVHGVRYDYGVTANGMRFTKETRLTQAGELTEEWVLYYTDLLGRPCKTEYADGAFAQSFFNARGQLFKERDPDGVITLYAYSPRGERTLTAVRTVATNQSDQIDFAGTDRITQTIRDVRFNPAQGTAVHCSRTFVWGTFQFNRSNLVASLETSVDGLKTWRILWNKGQGTTNLSAISYGPGGLRHQSDYAPDGSCRYQRYRYGRLELSETRDAAGTALLQTTYEYDAHNRLRAQTDRRNGTTTFGYNDADLVTRLTTPAPEPRHPPQVTLTHFNWMLQPTNVVFPDKTSAYTAYNLTGEIRQRHGTRTYPVAYTYDYAGRVQTLTTWKNVADQSSASVTTFQYHPRRGWLEAKRDADNQGPTYEYYPSGKLRKRSWARETAPGSGQRVQTLYAYTPGGELESVTYNDPRTPNLKNGYDRRGRLIQITQGTSLTLLDYNQIGQLVREAYPSGMLAGLWLTNGYDRHLRRSSFSLHSPSAPLHRTYSYDALSRLQGISNGQYSATYVYATNSSLIKNIQLKDQDHPRLSLSQDYDALQRLLSCAALPSGSALLSYEYAYNEANQPVLATTEDCAYWLYTYDPLGQLEIARKYWSDHTPVPGQQFGYVHDQSGNRTLCVAGGDAQGTHVRPTAYAANSLNQYTSRTSASAIDVFGADTNAVTVNGQSIYQKNGYYWTEVAAGTGSAPAWLNLTIAPTNQPPRSQHVFVPASPEQFHHDPDGNLTRDGRWTYTWDAENRLLRMEVHSAVGPQQRLDFTYDWQGRRIQKVVSLRNPSTGNYEPSARTKCVYDGWNLVAILDSQSSILQSFTWGLDLSGSLHEAGGIGGLLMLTDHSSTPPTTHFAASDGFGNLTALFHAGNGKPSAQYEYSPFGELLVASGPLANRNPFRFSTRCQDEETGLLYGGYRYYSPSTGRWLSREPLNELAFWKATENGFAAPVIVGSGSRFETSDYVYVKNCPPGNFDILGLASSCDADVQKAFRSRRNQKLLEKMARAGCPPPNIRGADMEGYCAVPGCLGDFSCSTKQGMLCCANLDSPLEIERTAHHELIHALDCCTHGLETCEKHLCSEIVAYYTADCEGFVNRLECAIDQMKLSMAEDPKCEAAVAAVTKQTALKCIKDWRAAQKRL